MADAARPQAAAAADDDDEEILRRKVEEVEGILLARQQSIPSPSTESSSGNDCGIYAYAEAKKRAPGVVARETNPIAYLRRYDMDADAAAEGILAHWEHRRRLFGAERAFLPMNITGDGALCSDDIRILNAGHVVILPDDTKGRTVVCFDRSRLESDMRCSDARLRASFYLLQVAASQVMTAKKSTEVVMVRAVDLTYFRFKVYKLMLLMKEAFPLRLVEVHVVAALPDPSARRLFNDTIQPVILQSLGKDFHSITHFHILEGGSENPRPPPKLLTEFNFVAEGLPTSMGGQWDYENFTNWSSERLQLEQGKPAASSPLDVLGDAAMGASQKEKQFETCPERVSHAATGREIQQMKNAPPSLEQLAESSLEKDRLLAEVEDAIEAIPGEKKTAYIEATKLCPDQIRKESNLYDFLRLTDYNVKSAAWKLISYWQRRFELFGKRAFFPMTQTGEGSLGRHETTMLGSGVLFVLPEDRAGRPVVFYDSSKAVDTSREVLRRVGKPGKII